MQNATHTLLIGSIRYQHGMYTPNSVFSRAFCAYEKYFMNFHTQLLRFSHTHQCDRAITWEFFHKIFYIYFQTVKAVDFVYNIKCIIIFVLSKYYAIS